MTAISNKLRELVFNRAQGKCEYCLLNEIFTIKKHELDHIIATKHGGESHKDNLCLSCFGCNRHKGSDLTSIDPQTDVVIRLFDPRTQLWSDHFQFEDGIINGLTACGRATVRLLQINSLDRVDERKRLANINLYP